jgi:chemotaxis-related protein WspD
MVCVALGRVVGLDESPESDRKPASEPQRRLLVIAGGTVRAACPVDEVQGIHRFHPRELKDVPATVSKGSAPYSKAVLSWRRRVVGLLDDRRLFESLERSLA